MHTLLIFNPVSGKKEARIERLGRIVSGLSEDGAEVTIYQTQGKGDAEKYLMEAYQPVYDRIICCGGDGTLHEVINGVIRGGIKIPIGYIPMGSTNDYAKNLGISKNTAMKCIKEGTPGPIDIGCVNGEYFNYVAAFGAFTNVSFVTPQEWKNTLGYFAYLLEGIKQLTDITPKKIRFSVDGDAWLESEVILGMITNSFSVAGMKNFQQNQIKLDDGKFEMLLIPNPKTAVELQNLVMALLNQQYDSQGLVFRHVSSVHMETEEALPWSLDGEYAPSVPEINITNHQKALKMLL